MRVTEELSATGHRSITAKHRTTFEITRDSDLTKRGDCIIAVNANRGLGNFSTQFLNLCKTDGSKILLEFETEGMKEVIEGKGSLRLPLSHEREIVGRRSAYVSDRTLMIHADKAAFDIDRDLVRVLKSPKTIIHIRLAVEL